jgi:hypothetical protein
MRREDAVNNQLSSRRCNYCSHGIRATTPAHESNCRYTKVGAVDANGIACASSTRTQAPICATATVAQQRKTIFHQSWQQK